MDNWQDFMCIRPQQNFLCSEWRIFVTVLSHHRFQLYEIISFRPFLYCQRSWPSMFHIMTCHWFGAKILLELMLIYCFLDPWTQFNDYFFLIQTFLFKKMHLNMFAKCWPFCSGINSSPHSAANMHQWIGSALVQIMACHLFSAKPLSKPMLSYYQLDPQEQTSVKFQSKYKPFHSQKCIWKYHLRNGGHFVQGWMS